MSKDKTTFSLFDFCKKKADKVQIYGEDTLDENGNIIPFIDQAAIMTHYLQLHNKNIDMPYAAQAEGILNLWYEFIKRENNKKNCGMVAESAAVMQTYLFPDLFQAPFQAPANPKFTFIDLFAGIGGFRMAFQNLGGECVFSSEWDEQAKKTYYANYGDVPFGDITKESTKNKIPQDFDILCAGFPCQAFSLAGKRLGFEETRGTLFFDVAEILRRYQPKAFFLENVKGLMIHDKGKTFKTILNTLDEVGYVVPDPQLVNAMYFGVPQHRERIYIVGFRKDLGIKKEDFEYPEQKEVTKKWIDVREENPVPAKYYLSTTYIDTLKRHKARHEAKGNGFGYDIIPDDGIAHAIVVGGMGRECNLVIDFRQKDLTPTTRIKGEVNKKGWRKMTPREWARLQGYPDMNKLELYYPIINVIREESKRYVYSPDVKQNIVIIDEDGNEYAKISMDRFVEESGKLLKKIKTANKRTFTIHETQEFMKEVGCTKLKAPSKDKADIHIVIHDLRTGMRPLLGFSIKSQLGSASTLLNAGTPTNITYRLTGYELSDEEIEEINAVKSHVDRMSAIIEKGCHLKYHDIEHSVFKNNLQFLDSIMPEFIARCLLVDSTSDKTSIKDCVEEVAATNPFEFGGSDITAFYAHKMKVLLLDSALGMTPAKEWTGKYDANGGYLVVRKDGEIVCYHFYNRNDVEDYLYNNTRFERASRERYGFGALYRGLDDHVYFKLNLQIRFKK